MQQLALETTEHSRSRQQSSRSSRSSIGRLWVMSIDLAMSSSCPVPP